MRKIAMIKDGAIANIAAWNGTDNWRPSGYLLIDITDSPDWDIGDLYSNGVFSPGPIISLLVL